MEVKKRKKDIKEENQRKKVKQKVMKRDPFSMREI